MRTIIYIDGFNLYYGSLKSTPYKWLDLNRLFKSMLRPEHDIVAIKYYTANVSTRAGNATVAIHQQAYIAALKAHTPCLEVHRGHFLTSIVKMRMANPTAASKFVEVIKTEEKGSDVNLAIHALNDAWLDKYECAVIVSNDSDLAEALKIIKQDLKKKIIFIPPGTPSIRQPSNQLKKWAKATLEITQSHLATCQLPNQIPGTTITKPDDW